MRPVLIGVAGGSGSGKTTVVREIIRSLGPDQVAVIHHDSYYRDLAHLPLQERLGINYDHPDALETELLVQHLLQLRAGEPVQVPVYDFTAHARSTELQRADPRKVVIVDGLFVLFDRDLRELMDIKLYVDADPDIRFIRRLKRDLTERGRTLDSIIRNRTEYDYDFRKDYFGWHIHYHLGSDEKRGIAKFMELLRKHGMGPVYEPKFVF